jgi:hypothetical protein
LTEPSFPSSGAEQAPARQNDLPRSPQSDQERHSGFEDSSPQATAHPNRHKPMKQVGIGFMVRTLITEGKTGQNP